MVRMIVYVVISLISIFGVYLLVSGGVNPPVELLRSTMAACELESGSNELTVNVCSDKIIMNKAGRFDI